MKVRAQYVVSHDPAGEAPPVAGTSVRAIGSHRAVRRNEASAGSPPSHTPQAAGPSLLDRAAGGLRALLSAVPLLHALATEPSGTPPIKRLRRALVAASPTLALSAMIVAPAVGLIAGGPIVAVAAFLASIGLVVWATHQAIVVPRREAQNRATGLGERVE